MKQFAFFKLSILLIVLAVLALPVNAANLEVKLGGPSAGASVSNYKVEFIYGFNTVPEVKNCSLIIDGVIKEKRSSLIKYDNNKITSTLEQGSYDWMVKCVDMDDNEIDSETRTLTVDVQIDNADGYEIIYNQNGLRSYVISISPGKAPLALPAMKSGEDIRIKTTKATYYFDLLKMGQQDDTNFVEFRDRSAGKIIRLLVGDSLDADVDKDETVDVRITLDNVERGVNAFNVVAPFPNSVVEEEPVVEENSTLPAEEQEEPVETEEETPAQQETPETTDTTAKPQEEPAQIAPAEAAEQSSNKGLLIAVIIVVAIVALGAAVYVSSRKPKQGMKKEQMPKMKEEKRAPEPVSKVSSNDAAEKPSKDTESFDVIKSTSVKRKK